MTFAHIDSSPQLGAVVRAERERRALTQTDLATQAGLARQWIVNFETGRLSNPQLQSILRVLYALDLQLAVHDRPQPDTDLSELMGFA